MTANSELSFAIEVDHLSRRFGNKFALNDVSLRVPRGAVYGLVGANGAGKTTFIKHLMGLLQAQSGSVRVLNADPVRDPAGALSRLGYLAEDLDLPGWMRVNDLLRYTAAFYPKWDWNYAEELRQQFELPTKLRVKNLSKGQRARVGLLVALAHRPDLLVLDEPSSGLDPIARRDILAAIISTVAEEGRSVLFSSHLLDEVERVSDHVAMLRAGRLVLSGPLDDIKINHRQVTMQFDSPQSEAPAWPGLLTWKSHGREATVVCSGSPNELQNKVEQIGGRILNQCALTLNEIFVARCEAIGLPGEEE